MVLSVLVFLLNLIYIPTSILDFRKVWIIGVGFYKPTVVDMGAEKVKMFFLGSSMFIGEGVLIYGTLRNILYVLYILTHHFSSPFIYSSTSCSGRKGRRSSSCR